MPPSTNPSGTPKPSAVLKSLAGCAVGPPFLTAGWTVDVTIPRAAFEVGSTPVWQLTAKLVIVFGPPTDAARFDNQAHRPLAAVGLPYCASVKTGLANGGMLGTRDVRRQVTTLTFSSVADMVACLSSPTGQAALTNTATFATATIVTGTQADQDNSRHLEEASLPPQATSPGIAAD